MKVEGSLNVNATAEELWTLLQDPEFLAEILPGCKELRATGEDQFEGIMEARVGPVSSRYTTKFAIEDKNEPHSYRLRIDGQGRGGFVRANTNVVLEPGDGETILKYSGEAVIGGTLSRVGHRLVDAAAKMLINKGFGVLKEKVEERLRS